MTDRYIVKEKEITNFFHDHVARAIRKQRAKISQTSKIYLINLLSEFTKSKRAFQLQNKQSEALAVIFFQALHRQINEQIRIFRELGDFSLFITGFFPDSFNRKIVDIDYYIDMGKNAYKTLSFVLERLHSKSDFCTLYQELSDKFIPLVNIIAEISQEGQIKFNKGLLRIYERWIKTGNIRDKRALLQQGIIPSAEIPKKFLQ